MPLTNAATLLNIAQAVFRTGSTDVYLLVFCFMFVVFFAAWFYSIIKDFTMFSSEVSGIIAVGLAIIFATTGIVAKIVGFLINTFGPIIAFIIIFLFFTSSYFLEWLIERKIRKSKKMKEYLEKKAGEEFVKEIGKEITKKK
jgi:ABC-type multidrug transport system fused ATPase/permease subunit